MSGENNAPTGETPTPPANTTPNPAPKPTDWMSPEAREIVTNANNEAARFRTEKNAAVEAHTTALAELEKAKSDGSAVTTERDALKGQLAKLTAAVNAGVPGEHLFAFAERLVGNTDEELKADAAKAMAMFSGRAPAATDPSQARGSETPAGGDLSAGGKFLRDSLRRTLS